jgi:hypothetical protein
MPLFSEAKNIRAPRAFPYFFIIARLTFFPTFVSGISEVPE